MSSKDVPLIVPLSGSRGWKPAERCNVDSAPIQILSQATGDDSKSTGTTHTSSTTPCQVCHTQQSRYTCPQCQIPYCSVNCYRHHSSETSSSNNGTSACTEHFYKERVASILRLEALEQREKTQELLNRHYHQTSGREEHDILESLPDFSAEDLYELLETIEENPDDISRDELLALLPPSLRFQFQRDLQDEAFLREVAPIARWHPWWRRQLVVGKKLDASCVDDETDHQELDSAGSTLDERLLKVPKFTSLCKKTPPQLLYNLFDILFSFCWTLRLYHGFRNAIENGLALESANNFIQQSSVLCEDVRHELLEQVLVYCTARATRQYPHSCNTHWSVLVEDCALIMVSPRLVGRALLEANDLLKTAIHKLKASRNIRERGDEIAVDSVYDMTQQQLRRVRKKLEYFVSWSLQCKDFGEELQRDIREWMHQCQNVGCDDDDETTALEIQELQFPQAPQGRQPSARLAPNKPLLQEVSTKLKR